MTPTKVLLVINDGKFFLSHRYELAKGLQNAGYEVSVACPDSVATAEIVAAGFHYFPISLSRRGLNPLRQLQLIYELNTLYKKIQPDIIHHFSIKPIIFGSIAAKFLKHDSHIINAPTGLGYVFTNRSMKAKILQILVSELYRYALRDPASYLIFQNADDKKVFVRKGLLQNKKTFIVHGAGIDTAIYLPAAEPPLPVVVMLPARLLWDKGIQEFIDAANFIKKQNIAARFVLVGDVDPDNPATISDKQLQEWVQQEIVEWWGWQNDMVSVLQKTHIVCLPSYREGLPKVLLEASACGKPIVTTDAPGCKEVVIDQETGYLVPIKNATLLAERLTSLIQNPTLRTRMGENGRKRTCQEFSVEKIVNETLTIYRYALKRS